MKNFQMNLKLYSIFVFTVDVKNKKRKEKQIYFLNYLAKHKQFKKMLK